MASVPYEVLEGLNLGVLETVNLVEWLATDQGLLLENVLAQNEIGKSISLTDSFSDAGVNKKMTHIAEVLLAEPDSADIQHILASHSSDIARCWSAYMAGLNSEMDLKEKLMAIRPFAADPHFGVREVAWMAFRPTLIQFLKPGLQVLQGWAMDPDPNIRRFASEVSRPRGVWCSHITALKENPEPGIAILELLKSDGSRYVQDSVGNWLNDASKTRPDLVTALCNKWESGSASKETTYIIKKALRSIKKKHASQ